MKIDNLIEDLQIREGLLKTAKKLEKPETEEISKIFRELADKILEKYAEKNNN